MTTREPYASRAAALKAGVRLEVATVLWMVIEATVSIGSGVAAQSILLTAFGFDSLIELLSGGVLLWRLSAEARKADPERIEQVEQRAALISAVLLALLCLYLVVTVILGIVTRIEPEKSVTGIAISAAAAVLMPLLAWGKRRTNQRLQSVALRADIAETVTCGYMAATVLIGVVLNGLFGLWWIEYVAAIGLLYWLIGETREAWERAREENHATNHLSSE
jgi:divalent metal cation (Fe/Co/Zn/Cd) transporter